MENFFYYKEHNKLKNNPTMESQNLNIINDLSGVILNDSLNKNMERINNNDTNNDTKLIKAVNIFRYRYEDDFIEELFVFSKIHQYDHRHDFKKAWETWITENSELIEDEVRHLRNIGYDGDILDKMFKSARYYFRKKNTSIKPPTVRKIYICSNSNIIKSMEDHINANINSGTFKPSEGFIDFCKLNMTVLKEQVAVLYTAGLTDSSEIKSKIKKTYKNRYYTIIHKKTNV